LEEKIELLSTMKGQIPGISERERRTLLRELHKEVEEVNGKVGNDVSCDKCNHDGETNEKAAECECSCHANAEPVSKSDGGDAILTRKQKLLSRLDKDGFEGSQDDESDFDEFDDEEDEEEE
jgi:hypothetical protein